MDFNRLCGFVELILELQTLTSIFSNLDKMELEHIAFSRRTVYKSYNCDDAALLIVLTCVHIVLTVIGYVYIMMKST